MTSIIDDICQYILFQAFRIQQHCFFQKLDYHLRTLFMVVKVVFFHFQVSSNSLANYIPTIVAKFNFYKLMYYFRIYCSILIYNFAYAKQSFIIRNEVYLQSFIIQAIFSQIFKIMKIFLKDYLMNLLLISSLFMKYLQIQGIFIVVIY